LLLSQLSEVCEHNDSVQHSDAKQGSVKIISSALAQREMVRSAFELLEFASGFDRTSSELRPAICILAKNPLPLRSSELPRFFKGLGSCVSRRRIRFLAGAAQTEDCIRFEQH
jgi:hypothetical protein